MLYFFVGFVVSIVLAVLLHHIFTRKKQQNKNKVSPINGKVEVVDYKKLCREFGCQLLTDDLLLKIEQLTNTKPHPMLRRNLYYAHRDLEKILNLYEKGKPFYLYTGRG